MKSLVITVALIFSQLSYAQSIDFNAQNILNSAIETAKEISMYSSEVDWGKLEKRIHEEGDTANRVDELKPAFEILFNGLNDHHGTARKLSDYSIFAHFTDYQNSRNVDKRERDQDTWKLVNDPKSRFESTILFDSIGYLKIVGVGPDVDGQMESERICSTINELIEYGIEEWIVDLRYNGGGNVNVMLAGLAPLLDTDTIVSIADLNGNIAGVGEIRDNNFFYFERNNFPISVGSKINTPKIAVLTSRWTISSGEFVAVAFKGQKNTRSFGEATGGYTTNNSWTVIGDKIGLSISTGIYCDRNGNCYESNVKPDVEMEFRVEEDHLQDEGILIAKKWLLKN